MSNGNHFDLLVIGGGINGAAVARDAAGRGLSVCLAEARDFAGATSSASSKLVHGGLRYLEQMQIRLVYESLHERCVLLATAPHLVWPRRFLLPVRANAPRPAWQVAAGLKLYDLLAGSARIHPSGRLGASGLNAMTGLRRDDLRAVLTYYDCQCDDARLTLEIALDAAQRGADISNYREVTSLRATPDGFDAVLEDARPIHARFVVNAAGPWANEILRLANLPQPHKLRLVRGSHIVVRRPAWLTDAFTLQQPDGRVVFVLPWQDDYLVIGTTDIEHAGPAAQVACTAEERDYLLAAYNAQFQPVLGAADLVWNWSGVRPLVDDGAANPSRVTREFRLDFQKQGRGGFLTIYGGKLTTHRVLAEKVLNRLCGEAGLNLRQGWTGETPLPGGRTSPAVLADMIKDDGPVPAAILRRWVRTYGAAATSLIEQAKDEPALRREIIPGVPEIELRRALQVEMARSADDFLYRRTKLFLSADAGDRANLQDYFGA